MYCIVLYCNCDAVCHHFNKVLYYVCMRSAETHRPNLYAADLLFGI